MHECAIIIFGQLPFDNITTNVLSFSWWALKNKLVNDILVRSIHILKVFHILLFICFNSHFQYQVSDIIHVYMA
jgi:hypothetical protein